MQFATAAWIVDFESFERSVGLSWQARRGFYTAVQPLHVLVLAGFEHLQPDYILQLRLGGVIITNMTMLVSRMESKYRQCLEFVNDYEFYCFIRWHIFDAFFDGQPFLHVDSDLFFALPMQDVARIFAGQTGTFGSPCLAAIANREWLECYKHHFAAFAADRSSFESAYQQHIPQDLRAYIGSDQDFVSVLERAGLLANQLPQSSIAQDYAVFINPLFPYLARPETPRLLESSQTGDWISGQPVLFWHIQNDFSTYVSRYFFLKDMVWDGSPRADAEQQVDMQIPSPYSKLAPHPASEAFIAIDRYFRHYQPSDYNPFLRSYVYQRFLIQREGRELFCNRFWWEPGIWL